MSTEGLTPEQIEALQALDPEQLEAIGELADQYNNGSVSRRDVMKLAGAGGLGALLGGGGSLAAVDRASAGTYQSGSLGTESDPIDITVDDISVVDSGGAEQGAIDKDGIDVPAVTTDQRDVAQTSGRAELTTDQTISTATTTQLNLDNVEFKETGAVDVDLPNNKLVTKADGTFWIYGQVTWLGSANWSSGDPIEFVLNVAGSNEAITTEPHEGVDEKYCLTASALLSLSADTDIIGNIFHQRGGDEKIEGFPARTFIQAAKVS